MSENYQFFTVRLVSTVDIPNVETDAYTLTSTSFGFANLFVDGIEVELGDWILLKDQTLAYQNGLWNVTRLGNNIDIQWQMTRLDPAASLREGQLFFTAEGNVNIGKTWIITNENPITAGATLLVIEVADITIIAVGQICADNSTDPNTPGYAYIGDKDTGLGYVGANSEALITGGIRALTIDSSQNITIEAGNVIFDNSVGKMIGSNSSSTIAFAFNGDENTGFHRLLANSFTFTTGGIDALKATSTQSLMFKQPEPIDPGSDNAVLTTAQLLNGVLIRDQGSPDTWTLPSRADVVTGINAVTEFEFSDALDFYIINTSTVVGNNITLAAGANGSIVGSTLIAPDVAVATRSEAHFRMRLPTNVSDYVVYRVS